MTSALITTGRKISVEVQYRQLLNIKVPEFSADREESVRSYGFAQTSIGLDHGLAILDEVLKDLIKLSQQEKTIQMIADEIQKTRRRVNALEYLLIPNIEETIKYISMKLEEQERNRQTQLMRIKEVIRAPMAPTSAYPGVGKYPL
jgi:V/A-type H+-transporting ATPase subunit D